MPVVLRETPLALAIAEVSRSPRPFVIFNRERHPNASPPIPPGFLAALPHGFTGDLLMVPTTVGELTAANLPLGRHRDQFVAGEPVMIRVEKLHEIPERAWGGQSVVGLEERARDGLYVTVALVTERMRACADLGEHRKSSKEYQRGEIFARLQPFLRDLSPINLFREGQGLLPDWFPGQTARQVLNSTYASVVELHGARPGHMDFAAIAAEQVELVAIASAVYAKTLSFLEAQHDSSAVIRELTESPEFQNATPAQKYDMQAAVLRERRPAAHQKLAHDMQGGPTPAQFVRAAASMHFNPAWVFLKVRSYAETFDFAMRLGRAERGSGAMLDPAHIEALRNCMGLEDAGADGDLSAIGQAGKCLRHLALSVRSRAGWDEFFAVAQSNPGPLWIVKAL